MRLLWAARDDALFSRRLLDPFLAALGPAAGDDDDDDGDGYDGYGGGGYVDKVHIRHEDELAVHGCVNDRDALMDLESGSINSSSKLTLRFIRTLRNIATNIVMNAIWLTCPPNRQPRA